MKNLVSGLTLLCLLSPAVHAVPFSTAVIDLLAGATLEESSGILEDRPAAVSGGIADLPLTHDAAVVSAVGNQASAFAGADTDFFLTGSVSVNLDRPGDLGGGADATIVFSGDFANPGSPVRLVLDFETLTSLASGATGGGELSIQVLADGFTILSDNLIGSASPRYRLDLGNAAGGTLELLLSIGTAAAGAGTGDVQGTVGFSLQAVPEPSTLSALAAGFAAMAWRRKAVS